MAFSCLANRGDPNNLQVLGWTSLRKNEGSKKEGPFLVGAQPPPPCCVSFAHHLGLGECSNRNCS